MPTCGRFGHYGFRALQLPRDPDHSILISTFSLLGPTPGPTDVAGAVSVSVVHSKDTATDRPNRGTVSLSDGTRITFATAEQFDSKERV